MREAVQQVLAGLAADTAVGVAVSGGPDSFALAVLAAEVAGRAGLALHVLHIHHGLQTAADTWEIQVRQLAQRLNLPVAVARVQVSVADGGMEAAARAARYRGLASLAAEHGIGQILLGHHLDDQAETVLLRLLRGAGPTGMGAMAVRSEREGIVWLRPWLGFERRLLAAVAEGAAQPLGLTLVRDPSNLDPHQARGLLRTRALPAIDTHWPGWRTTLARHARLAAEAAQVLDEVASADLRDLQEQDPAFGNVLRVSRWRALSPPRRAMVLRAWLDGHGLPMPSEARLDQMLVQLDQAAADRQILLAHAGARVRRYRNHIVLERLPGEGAARPDADAAAAARVTGYEPSLSPLLAEQGVALTLQWRGEPALRAPALAGTLHFVAHAGGIDPDWLRAEALVLRLRRGRERLQLLAEAPSRSLKNLYQEHGIPAWERPRLPLVWRGTQLVYAAGLGSDIRLPRHARGILLRWQSDHAGATTASRTPTASAPLSESGLPPV